MKKFLSLMVIVSMYSCRTYTKNFVKYGDRNDVVKNAITDFSKTTSLYKKNNIFFITVNDTNDIFLVTIGKNNMNVLTSEDKDVKAKIPTKFVEIDNKLFFWRDKDYPLTDEILNVYDKYGILQDDEGGFLKLPYFVLDDAQKVAIYYFCRNDLKSYRKIITNNIKYYNNFPELKCN